MSFLSRKQKCCRIYLTIQFFQSSFNSFNPSYISKTALKRYWTDHELVQANPAIGIQLKTSFMHQNLNIFVNLLTRRFTLISTEKKKIKITGIAVSFYGTCNITTRKHDHFWTVENSTTGNNQTMRVRYFDQPNQSLFSVCLSGPITSFSVDPTQRKDNPLSFRSNFKSYVNRSFHCKPFMIRGRFMNNIIQRNGNKQYAIQWPLVR